MAWISNHIYYIVRKWLLICVLLSVVVLTKKMWMGHTVSRGCKHWRCANTNARPQAINNFYEYHTARRRLYWYWRVYDEWVSWCWCFTERCFLNLKTRMIYLFTDLSLCIYAYIYPECKGYDCVENRIDANGFVMPSRLFYEFNSLVPGKIEWNFM